MPQTSFEYFWMVHLLKYFSIHLKDRDDNEKYATTF